MRNQRGQFALEGILLTIIFVAIILATISFFKKNDVISNLVKKPWQVLAGMLENGEWMPATAGQARHPSQHGRHVTIEGVRP